VIWGWGYCGVVDGVDWEVNVMMLKRPCKRIYTVTVTAEGKRIYTVTVTAEGKVGMKCTYSKYNTAEIILPLLPQRALHLRATNFGPIHENFASKLDSVGCS